MGSWLILYENPRVNDGTLKDMGQMKDMAHWSIDPLKDIGQIT